MFFKQKRRYYVTPTNYLELVSGYSALLNDKQNEIGFEITKLQQGLKKLENANTQVEEMSNELENKKLIVARKQKECEDLLQNLTISRREADEKQYQVTQEADRIKKEEEECRKIEADALHDLGTAIPMLEKANEELEKLTQSSIAEVKA